MTSDIKIGDYYVSIINGTSTCLALGPFPDNHTAALARVDEVNDYVSEHYPGGWFYAYGTLRVIDGDHRPGTLNEVLGV